MSGSELLTLLVFCTVMSFSPGPNTTLSTALASNHGMGRAIRFCLGVPVGWTLLLLASAGGVGALVTELPLLRLVVQGTGIAYLLWLASAIARTDRLGEAGDSGLDIGFTQGVALQFLNIKAWMIALTLTSGWVLHAQGVPTANSGERLAIVAVVMLLFAFFSNLTYALIGSLLRGWLSQGRHLLWFNRGLACVLVVTALWMIKL